MASFSGNLGKTASERWNILYFNQA